MQTKLLLLLTLAASLVIPAHAQFVPDDIQVGQTGVTYSDPEFHSGTSRVVFQNSSAGVPRVWIGEINPATGAFVSASGQDLLVDTAIATLGPTAQTNNGPEWGEDSAGVAVFYSKPDAGGLPQIFRASNLSAGNVTVTQLTNVSGPSWATNATVRQDATLPTTKFYYRYAAGPEAAGPSRWADEANPTAANTLPGFNTAAFAPSWIPGTEEVVYSRFTSQTTSELYRYSTTTLTGSVVTNEPAVVKRNIIAFNAPEFGNELCYACVADGAGLAIYRNLGSGYTRVATLSANNAALPYMYSPEIFQVGGVTYFAVVMQDSANYLTATEGAIYVLGLGADAGSRLVRRVDNGTAANRFEPEVLVGSSEVFVYFNIGGELRRARTGVAVPPPNPPPVANPDTATINEEGQALINVKANDSDPEGESFELISVAGVQHGSAVVTVAKQVYYTPWPNFFGTDTFTYLIRDARGAEATGTITVTVNAVRNDLFELAAELPTTQLGEAIGVFDFDLDGREDIFFALDGGKMLTARNTASSGYSVTFSTSLLDINPTGLPGSHVSLGLGLHDFNKDGRLDPHLGKIGNASGTQNSANSAVLNNGDGTFSFAELNNGSMGTIRSILFEDFDRDGYVDAYHSVAPYWPFSEAGNLFRRGLADGTFGPNIIDTILPGGSTFWHDAQGRGIIGFKAAVVRDFDGDGLADIISGAYADIADFGGANPFYQADWLRGMFVFRNVSTPGNVQFQDVSNTAMFHAYSNGVAGYSQMHIYSILPLDFDRDGDLDLFVTGPNDITVHRGPEDNTDIIRFYRNDSTPGNLSFTDITTAAGVASLNTLSTAEKAKHNLASGAAVDYDNDGWLDVVLLNRVDWKVANRRYGFVWRNNGNGTFTQQTTNAHGIYGVAGECGYGDLNNDGRLDLVSVDGNVALGGQGGNFVWLNNVTNTNRWLRVRVSEPGNPFGFGTKVTVYAAGTTQILGYDEARTDFDYRSKRSPVLHFGLGAQQFVDVKLQAPDGRTVVHPNLATNATQTLSVNLAPTALALAPQSVAEFRPVGTLVGTLSATDPNPGEVFSYALAAGAGGEDNFAFTVSGSQLLTNAVFNQATRSSYSVRIRVTDGGGLWREEVFTITVTGGAPGGVPVVDFDADGYDDVWQRRYGVSVAEFPPGADNDGDGSTNYEESLAGTNPRDGADLFAVREVSRVSNSLMLTFGTKSGKLYQLQSSESLTSGGWTDEGLPVFGNGSVQQLAGAIVGERRFFRVRCLNLDTDGDGLPDDAELLTGTDPAVTNSPANASGGAASDYDTLRSLVSVTTAVVTADAFEKEGTPAVVRLTRTFGSMPLTIPFDVGGADDPTKGSASPSDYTFTGASGSGATFGAGLTHDIVVNPALDAAAEVPETLKLTFGLPGLAATGVSPAASVKIRDAALTQENRRLYVAYLGREAGVTSTASGVATILVDGDNDLSVVSLSFSNLSSAQNTAYIRYLGNSGEIVRIPNGQVSGFSWAIRRAQILVTDQAMLDALVNGELYLSVSSATYSGGEIRGTFQPANGSITTPPEPPAPPTYTSTEFPNLAAGGVTNNPVLDRDIARFLQQCTYGPTPESIQEVRDLITANGNDMLAGYTAWINQQMDLGQTPSPSLMKLVMAADTEEFILRGNKPITFFNDPQFGGNASIFNAATRTWGASGVWTNNYPFRDNRRREWWTLVLNGRDQLRQRMAMALHEIVVISENDASIDSYNFGAANYWDMLAANAFGPYRTILEKVTYSPMMGIYLSHLKNQARTGSISPDENYAREIMQLFSIGLVQRHLDGSLKLDPTTALPLPTYDQGDITEMARVMTGLSFGRQHALVTAPTYPTASAQRIGADAVNTDFFATNGHRYWQAPWTSDMRMFGTYHDFNEYTAYTGLDLPEGVSAASKILFRGKIGQTVIPQRTASDASGSSDIADALDALAAHPNTPVFISRLLIQRFTTANPSTGYLYRVAQKYQQTGGNLGEVLKAILLDHEARSLTLADTSVSHGKPKEPILHYTAMLRGLKCYTGAPLANLASMPVPFTALESPQTTPYEASELAKFPAGTKRFRYFDTEAALTQSPQSAPSVFNWFLPDYVVPGPLAQAGLVAPELQVATESNVVNIINEHYAVLFATIPPGTTVKPGRGLDDFWNLANYRNAAGVQLSVPAYGQPYHATNNPTGVGYFSAATFDASPGGTESSATINNQLDNVLPDFGGLTTLYTSTYNASLVQTYAPNPVPASPSTAAKEAAHDAAALAVLDQCDLLFAAGYLKAKYGTQPPGSSNPRQAYIDALASGIGSRTTHTDAASNGFLTNAQGRCKNIAYLVLSGSPALILK